MPTPPIDEIREKLAGQLGAVNQLPALQSDIRDRFGVWASFGIVAVPSSSLCYPPLNPPYGEQNCKDCVICAVTGRPGCLGTPHEALEGKIGREVALRKPLFSIDISEEVKALLNFLRDIETVLIEMK